MTFDMRFAMEKVCKLKAAIAAKTDIPEEKQVLLISGGESLSSMQRVCSYSSAGTDTSPIFLFAKINIESNQPPPMPQTQCDDTDLTEMIESCMSMQPSLDTLVARTELAVDLNEQAIKQKEFCERLVHDQHLQQQGWAAVTANLEDLIRALKNKAEILMMAFTEFTKCKPAHKELLEKFGDGIKHLDSIPILPTLIESSNKPISPNNAAGDPQAATSTSTGSDNSSSQSTTLRQWINDHDNQNSLEKLSEMCWRGLERFTEANADQIRHEVQELLKSVNNKEMKEIKGLEERLFGLEKLIFDAKKVVDEQSQLASGFQSNQKRFSGMRDPSLLSALSELSHGHKEQLQMMLTNHKKMSDYRNRCIKAKHELSVNLHARLKWIMYIEQQISDLDGKLMIYKENLLRLKRHFEVVEQVHKAPELYLETVVEALRRRRFSRGYLHWANSIAKISQELYENEMNARKAFDAKLDCHFLANLFPGLTRSYPPAFATVQPDPFDTKVPRITTADIQYLQSNLDEELASKLHIPKDVPMPHIISAPNNLDESSVQTAAAAAPDGTDNSAGAGVDDDLEDRRSLDPTPPSSPTRQAAD